MQDPYRRQYIAQQIADIKLMFKIRAADLIEKREVLLHIGAFRSAILMKLYWHMNHNDLLVIESELKNQYSKFEQDESEPE